jgi:predicted nucleic acid-binding protein
MRYVVDTSVFNRILDQKYDPSGLLSDTTLVATRIQLAEIERTADVKRREDLLRVFGAVSPEMVLTETLIWDGHGSDWDSGKWSDGKLFESIKAKLDARKSKANNIQDAQIAETALANGWGLVTADGVLAEVGKQFGIMVIHVV